MSKFKVIEESRFLKNNLMKEITGGVIINSGTCTILSAHDGCGGIYYMQRILGCYV